MDITTLHDPSPQAQELSRAMTRLIEEQRRKDSRLDVPDTLVALELTRTSLLEDSGVTAVHRKVVLAVALLVAAVSGVIVFLATQ